MSRLVTILIIFVGFLAVLIFSVPYHIGGLYPAASKNSDADLIAPLKLLPEKVQVALPQKRVIPILLYHYVEYVTDERDTSRKSLNVEPHILEQQIKTLKEANYQFITPKELPEALKDKSTTHYVILSFDDGNRSFYDQTYPVLKRQNVPAVNYLIAGMLNAPNYLFGWQVTEMAKDNLIEFGLHGYTHQEATSLTPEEFKKALEQGSEIIEELTGKAPVSYAYPYGRYNESTVATLKESTLKTAMTTEKGLIVDPDHLYTIPRLKPGRLTEEALLAVLR